ncbi:MAG TPA: glycosyltransferase family 1 protein [Solirubrobacteraceae bacterium]|jgi:glycosyltransferase involved in cell wall biosynthesis
MAQLVVIDARDGFSPQLRGWGRYARCLADALAELPGRDLGPLKLEVVKEGGAGPEVVFEQVKLPLLLRRRRAALVHSTDCFLPLLRPCPGVVTIHDLAFEEPGSDVPPRTRLKFRALTSRAARSAQRIICPSDFTRDDVCSRYAVDPGKVRVVPEAPALALRPEAASPEPSTPYILAVGDLRPKKNLPALVSAYAKLWRDGVREHRLVLAGLDAGQGPRLAELAGPAPLELTGYLSDERLDLLLTGADLVVHPSLYEGFGLVLLEAMARGAPVLAARAGALPQTGGEAAAYFDPADPDSLASQLEALLTNPAARAEMARAGLSWAKRFSWASAARETVDVYRELVA